MPHEHPRHVAALDHCREHAGIQLARTLVLGGAADMRIVGIAPRRDVFGQGDMEKGQRRQRFPAVGPGIGGAPVAVPAYLILREPAVTVDTLDSRIVVRIEAVKQRRRRFLPGDLQHHVGQFAVGVQRVERPGIRSDDAADSGARNILFGVVVAQHHAERQVTLRNGRQHALPPFGGGFSRHHVAREDDQIGPLRIEDITHLSDRLLRLRLPVGIPQIEVHVGELRDLEFPLPVEFQSGPLRLRRAPQGNGAHKCRYLFHKQVGLLSSVSRCRSSPRGPYGSGRRPTSPSGRRARWSQRSRRASRRPKRAV